MRRIPLSLLLALLVPCAATAQQGQPLGPEFRVNAYTTNSQGNPSVAATPAGGFVAVWRSNLQDGSANGVFGQRYAGGGTALGSEFRVNTYLAGSQLLPRVAVDGSGNFVTVWRSYAQDGSSWGIFGQRYSAAGVPLGSEFRVNTYTGGNQMEPALAANSTGDFVVVWHSDGQDGSSYGIFGQRYASSGSPIGLEFRVNTATVFSQSLPRVSSDGSSAFVVVWTSYAQDGASDGVFAQRYAFSGAPLGPEFRVNTYTTGRQIQPSVASDATGGFVVVWASPGNGMTDDTFGQRFAASGGALGPEFRANTYTTSVQGFPAVAADAAGNFVVVWESFAQDGSGYGIFGQRYGGSGNPSGAEFRVNTYTPGHQFYPAVAADPIGTFVVLWQGYNGTFTDVFGQRFGPIVPVELMDVRVD